MMFESDREALARPGGLRLAAIWSILRLVWGGPGGLDRQVEGRVARLATLFLSWRRRRAELRGPERLDDHMLKDIGISRCDVERELRTRWFR
ncbi:MAG TPA: DUF1127 domain-containing protein [Candidatus Acidoferrum sp.]|nr:DUF1127 domain-containing protein [Candidatus Acidoferrum sp.]